MKYGVRIILDQQDVEERPWLCLTDLDRALRRYGPWPRGELGYWQLVWAQEAPSLGGWMVAFRCWPLGWAECPTCQGSGTSRDESTGGRCWDCRGGGVLPTGYPGA